MGAQCSGKGGAGSASAVAEEEAQVWAARRPHQMCNVFTKAQLGTLTAYTKVGARPGGFGFCT